MALGKTNSPMKLNIANLHFNFQHYNKSIHVFSYLMLSCLKLLAFKFLLNAGSTTLQHTYNFKTCIFFQRLSVQSVDARKGGAQVLDFSLAFSSYAVISHLHAIPAWTFIL